MALGGVVGGLLGGGSSQCLISTEAASAFGRESTAIWSVLLNAIMAVAAVYATYKQYKLLQDQMDLARDYYNIARRDSDHYHNNYVPKELAMLAEACAEQRYIPDYKGTQNRLLYQVNKQIGTAWNTSRRTASRYNTGQAKEFDVRMAIARAMGNVAAVSSGYRFEENKKLQLDEIRWSHMLNMANIGIKVAAQANASLAGSFQATAQASGRLASFFGVQASGLAEALGQSTFGRPNFLGGRAGFGTEGIGIRNFPGGFNGPFSASQLNEPATISSTANFQIGSGLFPSQGVNTFAGGVSSTGFTNTSGIGEFTSLEGAL